MNILATIIDEKHKEVELQSSEVPIEAILERVGSTPTPRGFAKALKLQSQSGLVPAVIAEVKLGSPSKGRFRTDLDIIEIAKRERDVARPHEGFGGRRRRSRYDGTAASVELVGRTAGAESHGAYIPRQVSKVRSSHRRLDRVEATDQLDAL